jgi:hypothetical protein
VELKKTERVRGEVKKERRLASGGLDSSIHVGRQQAVDSAALLEADHSRCITGEHRRAIRSTGIGSERRAAAGIEHIEREVVAIRPNSHFGVIIEVGQREGISVVGTGRVIGSRDRNTLEKRARVDVDYELGSNPAIRHLVVL